MTVPADRVDPLAGLAALGRRFDGPIPSDMRRTARAGGELPAARLEAAARSRLFDRLARQAQSALAEGRMRPTVERQRAASTLRFYRLAGLRWHDRAAALQRL